MNLKKLMVSALLVASTSLYAQDNVGWGTGQNSGRDSRSGNQQQPQQPSRQSDPWSNNGRDNSRDVELQVNAYFQNQARLDLIRDSYVRSQLQGQLIKEVIITASTQQGNGQARLLINGQSSEQTQKIGRQMMQYTFRIDPFSNSVGQSLRSLELEMRGNFYVEKVVFNMLENNIPSGPGPGNPSRPEVDVVRQQVNQSIQGEGGLQLYRLFSLGSERQGQALRRVNIVAHAIRGFAQASLLKNTESSAGMQSIGVSSTRLSFEVGGARIGQEIQNLSLYFRGDLVIEEVSLEFDRAGANYPGPGPVLDTRIEQIINQRLYETSGVALTQLMRIDSRQYNRIVNSVEITLRGSDYGARLSLCQLVQGQMNMNCGVQQIMQPGSQRIILSSVNFARLSELNLSVRMGTLDIERIVLNLR
jgi:hypothetical protein